MTESLGGMEILIPTLYKILIVFCNEKIGRPVVFLITYNLNRMLNTL